MKHHKGKYISMNHTDIEVCKVCGATRVVFGGRPLSTWKLSGVAMRFCPGGIPITIADERSNWPVGDFILTNPKR